MHQLDKAGTLLTRHGFTFTEHRRISDNQDAKKRLAGMMVTEGWPINDEMFLNAVFARAFENLGITPDDMKLNFELWSRFIEMLDITDILAEVNEERARVDLKNEEDARLHGTKQPELDARYWDCECEENYIHPRTQAKCEVCGALAEDQPDSHADEVEAMDFDLSDLDLDSVDAIEMGAAVVPEIDAPPPITDITTGEHD